MNTELIKIVTNEQGQNCVSARELHEGLEVEKKFTDWIKNQLNSVDAVENIDFFPLKGKTSEIGGRPSIDYVLTVDIAKEICMVVGVSPRTNEETKSLSKKFRKYFIECEKKLQEVQQPKQMSDMEILARAVLISLAIGFLLCINTSYKPSSVKKILLPPLLLFVIVNFSSSSIVINILDVL